MLNERKDRRPNGTVEVEQSPGGRWVRAKRKVYGIRLGCKGEGGFRCTVWTVEVKWCDSNEIGGARE